jgi:hypothetical protein
MRLLPQISTSVLCVHSILPTQMGPPALLIIVPTLLTYHRLPRPFIHRLNDNQRGHRVVTTTAFTVVSPRMTTRSRTYSEGRSRGQRNSPPSKAYDQDEPRRFEPPSQTLAGMKSQFVGQAPSVSSSSSRTSSSLAPRHVPKRLVMPSPLANATESAPSMALSTTASLRPTDGRPGHVLRKRTTSMDMRRPQRAQTLSEQTVGRGAFSFFRFGKGSKPMVREVRVTEPPKVGMSEKGQARVRTREEPRKLSKRR